jgi:hypothetical protein
MEDNFKVLKSNISANNDWIFIFFLNISLGNQTKITWYRQPKMEYDIKILKVEYLSNHLLKS